MLIEWQPIKTAPRDGTWFIIWTHDKPEVGRYQLTTWSRFVYEGDGLYRREDETIYECDGFNNFGTATHWMPLPEPPK